MRNAIAPIRLHSPVLLRFCALIRRPLIAITAALAMLLVGCTDSSLVRSSRDIEKTKTKGTTTSASPVPYKPGSERDAEAAGALRLLDPCALLDPDAGARAVGGTADQLLPGPDPAECVLEVLPEGTTKSVDAWTVTATVGVPFDDTDIELGATPQPVPAAEDSSFYRQESFDGSDCTIVRPVDDEFGIELEVAAPLLATQPTQPPCDVATRYLESVVDRWLEPPTRVDGRTEPKLPLAEQNPCAATAAVGEALQAEARAEPEGLYTCRIDITGATGTTTRDDPGTAPSADEVPPSAGAGRPPAPPRGGQPSPGQNVEVKYTIASDPASREPTNGIEYVTIAGREGILDRSGTDNCVVQVAIDDTLTVYTRDGERVQIVGVLAPSCETATQIAAVVLESVPSR